MQGFYSSTVGAHTSNTWDQELWVHFDRLDLIGALVATLGCAWAWPGNGSACFENVDTLLQIKMEVERGPF